MPDDPQPVRVLDASTGITIPGSTLKGDHGVEILPPDDGTQVTVHLPDRQWLQGKMTIIGSSITAAAFIASLFGKQLPVQQINFSLQWVLDNWASISGVLGALITAFGVIRKQFRKPVQIQVTTK